MGYYLVTNFRSTQRYASERMTAVAVGMKLKIENFELAKNILGSLSSSHCSLLNDHPDEVESKAVIAYGLVESNELPDGN